MTEEHLKTGEQFWEERYAGAPQVWSGKVNPSFVAAVEAIPVGTALELGCGEGADALWLASRGWNVVGLDISPTAVARASAAAEAGGLATDARFEATDLETWRPSSSFDLVYSCFLHTPVDFPRDEVLRRALQAVAPGGHFVLVAHAAPPPWAAGEHKPHHATMRPATAETAALNLGPEWDLVRLEDVTKAVIAPSGEPAQLLDAVVVARLAGSPTVS